MFMVLKIKKRAGEEQEQCSKIGRLWNNGSDFPSCPGKIHNSDRQIASYSGILTLNQTALMTKL